MANELLHKYFPELTEQQEERFAALDGLYRDWNAKINVISRKDIDNLYEHHVLHSLAIAKVLHFRPQTKVLDFGTGGGFPGIPLAIFFPETQFLLIDSVGKKIKVAEAVRQTLGLENVQTLQVRGETLRERSFDFVVTRAVMPLPDLQKAVKQLIVKEQRNSIPNGIIALKGGELAAEIAPFRNRCCTWSISDFFEEPWFEGKQVVSLSI